MLSLIITSLNNKLEKKRGSAILHNIRAYKPRRTEEATYHKLNQPKHHDRQESAQIGIGNKTSNKRTNERRACKICNRCSSFGVGKIELIHKVKHQVYL